MTPAIVSLLALAFAVFIQAGVGGYFFGRLSQRVQNLEKTASDNDTFSERLTRLEVQMGHVEGGVKQLTRGMEGVQRQLANLMAPGGKIIHFGHTE